MRDEFAMDQRIKELEEAISANDEYIQKVEALNSELLQELKNIADAQWWNEGMTYSDFYEWAKNRARHTIAKAEAMK